MRNNYLRRGQYPKKSNPSVIKHFSQKRSFPIPYTQKSGAPLTYYSRQKKGFPSLWTILVEILNMFLQDLFLSLQH